MKHLRFILFVGLLALVTTEAMTQVSYGLSLRTELYSRYRNPDPTSADQSPYAGSALLNLGIGPKMWIGGDLFTIAPEATVVISPFALSTKDYKGLGALSFPLMVKLEFLGLSNFNEIEDFGFGIGAGVQYTRTELFGTSQDFRDAGGSRGYYRTYIVQADFGFGASGFDIHGYIRYGYDTPTKANLWTVGVGYDFNLPRLIKETNSDF